MHVRRDKIIGISIVMLLIVAVLGFVLGGGDEAKAALTAPPPPPVVSHSVAGSAAPSKVVHSKDSVAVTDAGGAMTHTCTKTVHKPNTVAKYTADGKQILKCKPGFHKSRVSGQGIYECKYGDWIAVAGDVVCIHTPPVDTSSTAVAITGAPTAAATAAPVGTKLECAKTAHKPNTEASYPREGMQILRCKDGYHQSRQSGQGIYECKFGQWFAIGGDIVCEFTSTGTVPPSTSSPTAAATGAPTASTCAHKATPHTLAVYHQNLRILKCKGGYHQARSSGQGIYECKYEMWFAIGGDIVCTPDVVITAAVRSPCI